MAQIQMKYLIIYDQKDLCVQRFLVTFWQSIKVILKQCLYLNLLMFIFLIKEMLKQNLLSLI